MPTHVIKVKGPMDVPAAAREGARVLDAGGLVGFATETVYGLAAVASNTRAMDRLRELKDRPKRPFSVHIGRREDVHRYVADVPIAARQLIRKAWPGPVTLLLKAGGKLAETGLQKAGLYDRLCYQDFIGLRCPEEPVAEAMLSAVKNPVVAPSANLSGEPSPRTAEDVLRSLDGRFDLLIDSGPTKYGKDSTIISFDQASPDNDGNWTLVREGVYDERTIRRLLRRKILFVCTGNTCRSPIAAGLARKMLAEKLGCPVGELRKHGIEISSAGLFASSSGRATPEAVAAAREMGADISRHRSRTLTEDLINDADLVFCMTDFHVAQARRLAPSAIDKIQRLDRRGDVPDPIGGGPGIYRKTAERIAQVLKDLLDEGIL